MLQSISGVIGRIQQRIDLCDCHPLFCLADLYDFVASAHVAFLEYAEVEPGSSAGREQRRHTRLVHSYPDAVTGHSGLCDLEKGAADPKAITDADGIVGQSFDREVLAELSVDERGPF